MGPRQLLLWSRLLLLSSHVGLRGGGPIVPSIRGSPVMGSLWRQWGAR